jgi:arginase
MIPLVIDVPSPLGLRPTGLENAPGALRAAGLHERLGSPDVVRIDVPPYSDVRDAETGILNPQGPLRPGVPRWSRRLPASRRRAER